MKLSHYLQDSSSYLFNNDVIVDQDLIELEVNKLRLVEDKFYKIFVLNPCPMAINEMKNFTLVDVNLAFIKIIGVKNKKDVIGKDTTEEGLRIIKDKDKSFFMNEILTNGTLTNYLCDVRTLNGRVFKGLFSGTVIELDGQKCLLTICQEIEDHNFLKIFKYCVVRHLGKTFHIF